MLRLFSKIQNRIYASLAETCLQNAPPFKLCMFDVLTISTIHERRRGDDADNNDTCEQRTAEAILMENNHTTANNAGLTEDELRLEWQGWIKKGEVSDSENEEEETTYQDMLYASNTSRGESIALPHDGFTCQNIQAIVRLHCGKQLLLVIPILSAAAFSEVVVDHHHSLVLTLM